jgi:hypothetical protein
MSRSFKASDSAEDRSAPPRRSAQGSTGGAFHITSHAAARFRERVAPGLNYYGARLECIALSKSAVRTPRRTRSGDEVWVASDGAPVQFIIKVDPEYRLPVCCTVFGPDDHIDEADTYDMAVAG